MKKQEHQLTLLVPPAARSAHAELVAALGTENVPGQWMIFMEAVTRLLPDVLSSGRPTSEAIDRSVIGQLGFKSWTAMIEAPQEAGGLAWNVSAWKAWRRAWATVQAYPWLRDAGLTSSEVNTLAQESKDEFPASLEAYEELKKGRKDAAEKRRTESVAALKLKAEESEKRVIQAQATIAALETQLEKARGEFRNQGELIADLKNQLKEAQKPPVTVKLTRWEHLKAALLG